MRLVLPIFFCATFRNVTQKNFFNLGSVGMFSFQPGGLHYTANLASHGSSQSAALRIDRNLLPSCSELVAVSKHLHRFGEELQDPTGQV